MNRSKIEWKERLRERWRNGGSETCLTATADCPKCLSKKTVFDTFEGKRINDDRGMMIAIDITGEEHYCLSCDSKFIKNDGPWVGLELAVWHEAMKQSLSYSKVIEYTVFCKRRPES